MMRTVPRNKGTTTGYLYNKDFQLILSQPYKKCQLKKIQNVKSCMQ